MPLKGGVAHVVVAFAAVHANEQYEDLLPAKQTLLSHSAFFVQRAPAAAGATGAASPSEPASWMMTVSTGSPMSGWQPTPAASKSIVAAMGARSLILERPSYA